MKATKKIIAGIGLVAAVGLIIYLVHRRKTNRMDEKVAEHGYETASDILFPGKNKGGRKNKYGPVLPS
jgi:hypothetical protein